MNKAQDYVMSKHSKEEFQETENSAIAQNRLPEWKGSSSTQIQSAIDNHKQASQNDDQYKELSEFCRAYNVSKYIEQAVKKIAEEMYITMKEYELSENDRYVKRTAVAMNIINSEDGLNLSKKDIVDSSVKCCDCCTAYEDPDIDSILTIIFEEIFREVDRKHINYDNYGFLSYADKEKFIVGYETVVKKMEEEGLEKFFDHVRVDSDVKKYLLDNVIEKIVFERKSNGSKMLVVYLREEWTMKGSVYSSGGCFGQGMIKVYIGNKEYAKDSKDYYAPFSEIKEFADKVKRTRDGKTMSLKKAYKMDQKKNSKFR